MFIKGRRRQLHLGRGLPPEYVRWAYRLFLDREPENEHVVRSTAATIRTTPELRRAIMASEEYRAHAMADTFAGRTARVVNILDDGLRVCVDLADPISGAGVVLGMGEIEERTWIRDLLRPGDIALDLGANVGLITVTMASSVGEEGHVIAFEPLPAAAQLLRASIRENGFEDRVEVQQVAAGDRYGSVQLLAAPNGSLSATHLVATADGHTTVQVPMVRLDDLEVPRPVRLIKADIEGSEPFAFDGAERLLEEDRPLILSEINPPMLNVVAGVSAEEFIRRMSDRGYSCTSVSGEPILDVAGPTPRSAVFRPI